MRTTIVLLLAALCLIGWWTLTAEVTLPPGAEVAAGSTGSDDTVTPAREASPVEASVAREIVTAAGAAVGSLAPELADDAEWVEVLIVSRDSGEPVANANVWWTNQMQQDLLQKMRPHERAQYRDTDALAKKFGWSARSDEHGKVRVVPGESRAVVIAEKDGRYGTGTFGTEPPPRIGNRVEIEPDLTLRVRVLSANGEPARGVPVAYTEQDPDKPRPTMFWWWNNTPVDTDEHGIASFAHAQLRQRRMVNKIEQPVLQWLVHIRSPGLEMEPVAVDAQSPPSPVEVQLPPTGHLRVRVVTGGKPWPHLAVRVWPSPEDKATSRNHYMNMSRGVENTTDKDGWFECRHVGLRKQFRVSVKSVTAEVTGPVQPGETAERTLNVDEHAIVLAGRVLRPDGKPLGNERCKIRLRGEKGLRTESWVTTEPDGAFVFTTSPGKDGAPLDRMAFEIRWDPEGAEGLAAQMAPRVLHVGRTELGDVRLRPANLIVAGRIVPSCELKAKCNMSLQKMMPPRREGGEPRWRGMYEIGVQVDDDLQFSAYGELEPGRYRLQVWCLDLTNTEHIEFSPGARDLQIPVTCGNELLVHCLLPEPLDGSRVKLLLKSPLITGEGREPNRLSRGAGEADYTWRGIVDGTYTLEVRPHGWGQTAPLHRIEGIRLPIGGNRIGMIPDIDMRGVLSVLDLEVAFEDGQSGSAVVFPMPQQQEVWHGIQVVAGKTMLPVANGSIELLVGASRHEPVRLSAVQGAAVATLRRRPTTQVQIVGLESISADVSARLTVKPAVEPVQDKRRYRAGWNSDLLSSLLRGTSTGKTLRDHKAELVLGDGAYSVTLRITNRSTRKSGTLKQFTPAQISSGGTYQLQVSPTELAAVLQKMAQDAAKQK